MFENHRKSLILHCERSELRLHFERTKVVFKMPKKYLKSLKLLTSNSVTRQVNFSKTKKLAENCKIENSNATFWMIFKHCATPWFYIINFKTHVYLFHKKISSRRQRCQSAGHIRQLSQIRQGLYMRFQIIFDVVQLVQFVSVCFQIFFGLS